MLDDLYHALDPVIFSIGPFSVRWYGLGYILGIVLGIMLLYRVARRWDVKIPVDSVLTIMIAAILGIILGGRVGYVLFYGLEYYVSHPLEILAFTNGGMSFHGGLLGMVVAAYICARRIRIPMLRLGDLIVIAAPIGIFFVRFANFINGELWGAPTDAPWGVVFDGAGSVPRHPTQLYEAFLEGIVLFVILFVLSRRVPPRRQGFYIGVFLACYGIFRILVEFVREPDAHIGYLFGSGWITMGMVLSAPMVIAGVIFLVYALRKKSDEQERVRADDAMEEVAEEALEEDEGQEEEPAQQEHVYEKEPARQELAAAEPASQEVAEAEPVSQEVAEEEPASQEVDDEAYVLLSPTKQEPEEDEDEDEDYALLSPATQEPATRKEPAQQVLALEILMERESTRRKPPRKDRNNAD